MNGYRCRCAPGWTGTNCDISKQFNSLCCELLMYMTTYCPLVSLFFSMDIDSSGFKRTVYSQYRYICFNTPDNMTYSHDENLTSSAI